MPWIVGAPKKPTNFSGKLLKLAKWYYENML
jgi:hypothetical protein